MNKLIIPLLAGSALLGGCHHATVRHTVQVPVDVVEHRHVVDGVVIVHQHEGDYRRPHRHDHYDQGRVVVVTPPPRVEHRVVTVIERDGRGVPYDRGHHATPQVPPRQERPQLPSQRHGQPQVPSHPGQAHPQPQHGDRRADAGGRPKTPSQGGQGRGEQKEQKPERGKSPAGKKEKTKPGQKRGTGQAPKSDGDDRERPSDEAKGQERWHR